MGMEVVEMRSCGVLEAEVPLIHTLNVQVSS